MPRRLLPPALLAAAALPLLAALLLAAPRDVVELLVGLAFGRRLAVVQLALLGAGAALLLAHAAAAPPAPAAGAQRRARRAMLAAAALAIVAVLARDRLGHARDTVTLVADGTPLEGTLHRPRRLDGRAPAVLLLHGSGPKPRDGYDWMARRFVERGFVVLNVDKRGVGGSGGRYTGDDLAHGIVERRAADARAALAWLAARDDVDTARVGLAAISQGGWVVPLLLGGDSPARFAVSLSGSAVSSGEEGAWSEWSGEDRDHFGYRPPPAPFEELDVRLRGVPASAFDPRPALARMRAPSLWLYGAWDGSQPTAASVRVLDSLRAAGAPVTHRVFAAANHGLMVVRGPGGTRFPDFAPGVWDTVFAWAGRAGVAGPVAAGR